MADDVGGLWNLLETCAEGENTSTLNWNDIKNVYERLKMLAKDFDNRTHTSSSNIEQTQRILVSCETVLASSVNGNLEAIIGCLKAVTEIFRFLRNSSAGVSKNQEYIMSKGVIKQVMHIANILLKPHFQESDERKTVNDTIKSAVQLMGNVVVGNSLTQDYMWRTCYPEFFLSVMTSANLQIQNCICMVIYNSMSPQQRVDLVSSQQGLKIMSQVLHLCSDHEELEWGYFIIDALVKNGHVGDLYTGLEFDPSARIILLDLIQVHLTGNKPDSSDQQPSISDTLTTAHTSVPETSLIFLAAEFERVSDTVFFHKDYDYSSAENMMNALLISRLLHLLSTATALYQACLQSRIQLLHTALDLLHQTNEPENRERFSNITSIGQSKDSGKLSPSHGFKRDLVRLIANMCYHHQQNQDEVRLKEGIPLLLDHCNIDDHNPYICQWAVFAIRNLLENNMDNQKVVAGLDKQGLADNSRLHQLGVEVKENEEGKIKIVQKSKN